jgi:hypothetical protein
MMSDSDGSSDEEEDACIGEDQSSGSLFAKMKALSPLVIRRKN